MPKQILVDPAEERKAGRIRIKDIPLNQYQSSPEEEKKKYGKERLVKVYQDMVLIREFETMLNSIKIQGEYRSIKYNHLGPAHLSIGQESAAVGQCLALDIEDKIFGSHRSHGEILAKCFSAIHKLDETLLQETMENYMDGAALGVVEQGHQGTVRELATDYILQAPY